MVKDTPSIMYSWPAYRERTKELKQSFPPAEKLTAKNIQYIFNVARRDRSIKGYRFYQLLTVSNSLQIFFVRKRWWERILPW